MILPIKPCALNVWSRTCIQYDLLTATVNTSLRLGALYAATNLYHCKFDLHFTSWWISALIDGNPLRSPQRHRISTSTRSCRLIATDYYNMFPYDPWQLDFQTPLARYSDITKHLYAYLTCTKNLWIYRLLL